MDTIEHLEELSKLKFTDAEKKNFRGEFETILEFVGEIRKINLNNVYDDQSGLTVSEFRKDEVQKSMEKKDALVNAPEQLDGCFVTPMVIE